MEADTTIARDATRPMIPEDISITIATPECYTDHRLYEAFAWLRRNEPLGIAHPPGFDPFWVAARQKEVRQIAMNADVFRSEGNSQTLASSAQLRRMRELLGGRHQPVRAIVHMDAPDHPKYRAVTAEFFHARSLDVLSGQIREIASGFADRLADFDGECDFAEEVGFLYPLRVIMSILGVPPEDEPFILRLTQQFVGATDSTTSRANVKDGADISESKVTIANEMYAYFDDLLAERRKNPKSDLISVIAHATIDGDPMPVLEARSYCFVAATAGHDTTSSVTNGSVHALATQAGLLDRIRGSEPLINATIEEAARYYPPAKMTMRTVARDFELAGRRFKEGEWVGLAWASANRDEDVISDPETFSIDRRPNKLLSFGNGPHVCIGQHLARLELRLMLDELTKHFAHVELNGPTRNLASFLTSGIKSLPIRYRLR